MIIYTGIGTAMESKKLKRAIRAHEKYLEKKRLKKDREALLDDERTPIARKISRNIDQILIVSSVAQPDFSFGVVDRFLILASYEDINPILCISKIDLVPDESSYKNWMYLYETMGVPVYTVSAIKRIGIDSLTSALRGKRTALAGHSGVGKSTILNAICPSLKLETGQVNLTTGKGKHITRSVRLHRLDDETTAFDLPGIRLIDFPDLTTHELAWHFPDFRKYNNLCKFRDCSHLIEPECAVIEAMESGELDRERYNSYLSIIEELQIK